MTRRQPGRGLVLGVAAGLSDQSGHQGEPVLEPADRVAVEIGPGQNPPLAFPARQFARGGGYGLIEQIADMFEDGGTSSSLVPKWRYTRPWLTLEAWPPPGWRWRPGPDRQEFRAASRTASSRRTAPMDEL